MKQTFEISPAGIARIKKKMVRQFIPLFLIIAVFAFVSWWFILRPSLHFGNPRRWVPGIVMLSGTAVLFVFYLFKIRNSLRKLKNFKVNTDDLFITSLNFLGTELTIAYTDIRSIEKMGNSYYLKTNDWQKFIELYPEVENREELLVLLYRKRPDLVLKD